MNQNKQNVTNESSQKVNEQDYAEILKPRIFEISQLTAEIDSKLGIYAGIGDLAKEHLKQEIQGLVESYGAEDPDTLARNISTGAISLEEVVQLQHQIVDLFTVEYAEDYIKNTLGYYYPRLSTPVRPIYFEKPTQEPICIKQQKKPLEQNSDIFLRIDNIQETPNGDIFIQNHKGDIFYFVKSGDSGRQVEVQSIKAEAGSMQVIPGNNLYVLSMNFWPSKWAVSLGSDQYTENVLSIVDSADSVVTPSELNCSWDMKMHPRGDIYGGINLPNLGMYKLTRNELGSYVVTTLLPDVKDGSIIQILPDGSLYIKDDRPYFFKYNPITDKQEVLIYDPYRDGLAVRIDDKSYLDYSGDIYFVNNETDEENAIYIRRASEPEGHEITPTKIGGVRKRSPIQVTSDRALYYVNQKGDLVRSKFINGEYSESELIFSTSYDSYVSDFQVCNGHIVCGTDCGGVFVIM